MLYLVGFFCYDTFFLYVWERAMVLECVVSGIGKIFFFFPFVVVSSGCCDDHGPL